MAITKPTVLPAWADAGDKVQPSNAELSVGWPVSSTPPSRQRFNWVLNFVANAVRYFSRRGLVDYDAAETYMTGDRVIGDDGKTYKCLVDNTIAFTPSTNPAKWGRWGHTVDEMSSETGMTGSVAFLARSTAPTGWLKANGSAVSRTTYAALFSAIGTTFGAGDGSTTFNLPDLRGEFLRGFDDGRGIDSGRTFGSWQTGSPVVHDDNGGVAGFNIVTPGDGTNVSWSAISDPWVGTNPLVMYDASAASLVNASTAGFTNMSRPRNVALLACIKY